MKMEFLVGGHICSILQVVALVVCLRGNVSGEIAQGCVGDQLNLRCPETKVIKIIDVVLGNSDCLWKSCCITDQDCTRTANKNHKTHVHRRCDKKHSCSVEVLRANITCGYMNWETDNDFERITYNCKDEQRNDTTNSTGVQPTGDQFKNGSQPEDKSPAEKQTADSYNLKFLGIVIVCAVGVIVIIAIVASVSVVMVRRTKRRQVKSSDAVKMPDIGNGGKEAIYDNESEGTNLSENVGSSFHIDNDNRSKEVDKSLNSVKKTLETPASDIGERQGVATGRLLSDHDYEELDDGKNYEPLIVYEQLQ